MLKARIIPTLLLKDHGLVKGEQFDSWRRVGTLAPAVRVYNTRDVDELILLDIAATPAGRPTAFEDVEEVSPYTRVPLTVGGGVTSLDGFAAALGSGADKVSLNSICFERSELVTAAADRFGAQCVVVSIDARLDGPSGAHVCFSHAGRRPQDVEVAEWARRMEDCGAGELVVCSIDRDGTMKGYDLALIEKVASAVDVPVIASGGCGGYEDMRRALVDAGASAVSAASIFHFTEQTPREAREYLRAAGVPVRGAAGGA